MSAKLARVVGSGARYAAILALHIAAGAAGGMVLGTFLALASTAVIRYEWLRSVAIAYAALTTIVYAWTRGRLRTPLLPFLERSVQVSSRWTMPAASGVWGFQLGLGVATYAVTPILHVFLACALFLGPAGAFGVGVLYGLGRSLVHSVGAAQLRHSNEERKGTGLRQALTAPVTVAALLAVSATAGLALSGGL